jgi:dUTPase
VAPLSRPGTTFTGRNRNPGYRVLAVNICRGWLSAEKKVIPARGKALVDTQLSIAVPLGTYGRIAPRSGLG